MRLQEIIRALEDIAPLSLQESYDNSGLLTGHPDMEIKEALVCLDSTEEVIDEAIRKGCNLVIAHHPIIFSGLKKITGKNYIERVIIKAIKNDIAIYAIHTNLDNVKKGVNGKICEVLGLTNTAVLSQKPGWLRRLITFCPHDQAEEVRQAMFKAGAGHIGDYDSCSFNSEGEGTFRGNEDTDPFIGKPGELTKAKEVKIETIYPYHIEKKIIKALKDAHPYEEVAYDIFKLENNYETVGAGMVGELEKEMDEKSFLEMVSEKLQANGIRYTRLRGKKVKRVAVCGGSGSFLLGAAIADGADVLVTADFKYHQFFDAENKIVIADVGHYESEQYTKDLILELLKKKIPNFAVRLTEMNTNPINYLRKND